MFPKEGDFVTIKSEEEIRNTLDDKGELQGVWFADKMYHYCGRTLLVKWSFPESQRRPAEVQCEGWCWCREWFWTQEELEANDESSFDDNLVSAIL